MSLRCLGRTAPRYVAGKWERRFWMGMIVGMAFILFLSGLTVLLKVATALLEWVVTWL